MKGIRRRRRLNLLETSTVFAFLVSVLVIHVVSGQDVCRDPSSDDERAVMLNQPVCFICPRGTSNIEWLFDGEPVSSTDGLTAYSNGSLFIDSVLQKFIGPTFLCQNTNNPAQRASFSLSLASISPPTISNKTLNETDNLSIRCRSNANPFPHTVVWLRNGQVVSTNSLLEISNIQRAQAGLYTCNTTNTIGSADSTITVTVQYAPSIDLTVTSPVPWILNTSLMCSFDAVPTPTITWKVNGTEIVSGNENYIIRTLDTTSFLDIISTELENTGQYSCEATNLLGTSSDQEELIVQVPPDPPSGFSSQDVTTDGFNLRWMTQFDGNSAITSAFVMYRVSGSSDPPTNATADAVSSHTLSGLMANTPYTVTVFLINAIGASSGGEHQVTTLSLLPDVNSPQGTQDVVVIATLVSAGAVLLVVVLLVVAVTICLVVKCAHTSANRKEDMYCIYNSRLHSDQERLESNRLGEDPQYEKIATPESDHVYYTVQSEEIKLMNNPAYEGIPPDHQYVNTKVSSDELGDGKEAEGKPKTRKNLHDLPNFFSECHFLLYGNFEPTERRQLTRYIMAYDGHIENYMGDSVSHVVSNEKWDSNFDDALKENASLLFITPGWVFACHNKQKLISPSNFRIAH